MTVQEWRDFRKEKAAFFQDRILVLDTYIFVCQKGEEKRMLRHFMKKANVSNNDMRHLNCLLWDGKAKGMVAAAREAGEEDVTKVSFMPMGAFPNNEVKATLKLAKTDDRFALQHVQIHSASRTYDLVTSEEGAKIVTTKQVTETAVGVGHPQGYHMFSLGNSEVRNELGDIVQGEHFGSIFKHDENVIIRRDQRIWQNRFNRKEAKQDELLDWSDTIPWLPKFKA